MIAASREGYDVVNVPLAYWYSFPAQVTQYPFGRVRECIYPVYAFTVARY